MSRITWREQFQSPGYSATYQILLPILYLLLLSTTFPLCHAMQQTNTLNQRMMHEYHQPKRNTGDRAYNNILGCRRYTGIIRRLTAPDPGVRQRPVGDFALRSVSTFLYLSVPVCIGDAYWSCWQFRKVGLWLPLTCYRLISPTHSPAFPMIHSFNPCVY